MKNLLKVAIALVLMFTFSKSEAQIKAGVGAVYGTGINNLGLSINGKYQIDESWSAAPAFTLFLPKTYLNWSILDLDANYQLPMIETIKGLYAIGGLNLTFYKIKYNYDFGLFDDGLNNSSTGSDAGINLGVGMNLPISEKFDVVPEFRFTLGGASFLRLSVNVLFDL